MRKQMDSAFYCSDYGFNFVSLGEQGSGHIFAQGGGGGHEFSSLDVGNQVSQDSIGRLIYARAGGNPDYCLTLDRATGNVGRYRMYGIDLV